MVAMAAQVMMPELMRRMTKTLLRWGNSVLGGQLAYNS